jgi:hypothetical protein
MLPLSFPALFILGVFETFYIYDDHIDVRGIFRIKNSVYYDKVSYVEEAELVYDLKSWMYCKYYIFHDGRKRDSKEGENYRFNERKLSLRIYKTEKLEDYIKNTLKLPIKVTQPKSKE